MSLANNRVPDLRGYGSLNPGGKAYAPHFHMATLSRIRYGGRSVTSRGRVYHYASRVVWRLKYRVWLPSGGAVERSREFPSKSVAVLHLGEAEKMEVKNQRGILAPDDIRSYHAMGLLHESDACTLLGSPASITWEQLLEIYEAYNRLHCRPQTRQENIRRARKLAQSFMISPTGVTKIHIERWQLERRASNRTRNIELNILWILLDPAFPKGENPARQVTKLNESRMGRLPRALNPEEDEKVMRAMWRDRKYLHGCLWPMYLIYRFGGLRRSEARVLPWKHLLEDRVLVQEVPLEPEELAYDDEFLGGIWRPKEGDARAITLPRWVVREIKGGSKEGRLIFSYHGKIFPRASITQAFNRILKRVSYDLTLHDLRHTFTTELMENGVPPARVQRLAGHKRLATTERYTHVTIEGQARNLEGVYRSLGQPR